MANAKIKAFKALTILFIVVFYLLPSYILGMEQRSKIILVLGTSSSGKSTICSRLSAKFSGSSLISMDSMDEELDEGMSKRERQQFPQEWITLELCILCKKILTQAASCNVLIVDAILQETARDLQIDQTASFVNYLELKGFQVYTILVHCPILQLVHNVSKRNMGPRGIERRSPVSVVGEYVDTYLSSPSSSASPSPLLLSSPSPRPSPRPSRPAPSGAAGSFCDGEVARLTSPSHEFVNPNDLEQVLAMFSQMKVDPALEIAKNVLLARLRSASSEHTPLPVEINCEDYNFIFHNNSSETFESEFSRLISELSGWLAK